MVDALQPSTFFNDITVTDEATTRARALSNEADAHMIQIQPQ